MITYVLRLNLILLGMCFSLSRLFAEGEQDITSSSFKVNLVPLDPFPGASNPGMGTGALIYILGQIADILLFAVPIIAGISFLVAGYYFILSSGNSEKATQAKVIIKWNLIAMLVAFLSYGIVNLVLYILNLI